MDSENTVEDGEIIEDSGEEYTPLERPSNYSSVLLRPRFPVTQVESDEEEVESSSDTDSDSDTKAAKRPKLKLKPQAMNSKPIRKKYDIWSSHVQEDVLLQNLVNCDVSYVDRSRNTETYPIRKNKRTHNDTHTSDVRPNKRREDDEEEDEIDKRLLQPRTILDVHVTLEDCEEDIAKDIANKLYEENEELIHTVVLTAGKQKAFEFFNETKRIEEDGGMLVMNKTRRRTPGGVFLFLVKHDHNLTREQHSKIFEKGRQKLKAELKAKRKLKLQQIKDTIAASKSSSNQNLPELLTRAELCVKELSEDTNRIRRESDDVDVKNPPPSPVTDCHDNSIDCMEGMNKESESNNFARTLTYYSDDCLNIGNDMDLF